MVPENKHRIMNKLRAIFRLTLLAVTGWTACLGAAIPPVPFDDREPPPSGGVDRPTRVEGELLVKFRGGSRGDAARRGEAKFGHKVKRVFEHIGWQSIQLPSGMTVDEDLIRYQQDPDVLAVEPNTSFKALEPVTAPTPVASSYRAKEDASNPVVPNDPLFPQQWGLSNVCAPFAWSSTNGSTNVVVAVIDSGINHSHEDLAANIRRNPWQRH